MNRRKNFVFFSFYFPFFFFLFSFFVDIELLKQTFVTQIDVTRKNKTANIEKQKNVNTTITRQKKYESRILMKVFYLV